VGQLLELAATRHRLHEFFPSDVRMGVRADTAASVEDDELIADRKYQFVYVFTPSPIKGATGSNGCPIAMT